MPKEYPITAPIPPQVAAEAGPKSIQAPRADAVKLAVNENVSSSLSPTMYFLLLDIFLEFKFTEILSHYASSVVFLLLGGFILAQGFEKSQLHRRIALKLSLIHI